MGQGAEVAGFHPAECSMISSPTLVRPRADKLSEGRRDMGRYEHANRYQVLGADADDEEEGSDDDSLAEPFVDTDVEISDPEIEDDEVENEECKLGVEEPDREDAAEGQEAHGAVRQRAGRPRARLIRRPLPMSRAERERHVAKGHVNYNSACDFRVRTRGRADPHRRVGREQDADDSEQEVPADVPTVSFAFCFLSQLEQEKSNTVLVARDGRNKTLMATVCPSKSTTEARHSTGVCRRLAAFLDFLGYPRIASRPDLEKSTLAMRERVKTMRRTETMQTKSKKRVSQSNGVID